METQFKNKRVRENGSPTQSKSKREKPSATEERQVNVSKANNNHLFVAPAPVKQSSNKSIASCDNPRSSSTENIRNRSISRESKFRNVRPKHTKCNTTADIGITIYLKESNRFDPKTFDDEIATKISKDVARHRTRYDFTMKGYENMRHDIDLLLT